MKKYILQLAFLFLIMGFTFINKKHFIKPKEYDYNVEIYRDIWGVPHIYGDTDEDVAFGLAYAHSEDDFETIQTVLIATRGKLASILGKKGAPNDYLINFLKIWDIVNDQYETSQKPLMYIL